MSLDLALWADPVWRLSNLYTIVTDDGQEIRFTPNDEQLDLLKNLHNLNLCLKARQLGFTTFLALVALDQCLFVKNFTAVLIAHTLPDAKKIFRNKVKRVYDALPDAIKAQCPLAKEAAEELVFVNGSSMSVTTSSRGGTTNFLHISEMGKIARMWPEKAKEIVTGAFQSVPKDGIIVVESTAEGQDGWYYEACMQALKARDEKRRLTSMDWRLHFYPWFNKASYRMSREDAGLVSLTKEHRDYFANLENKHGIKLDDQQKAWWVKKKASLLENMGREFPSTPEEAFAVALEGAILAQQMAAVRKAGRIGVCPVRPSLVVNTFWDFGVDDSTSIWLHQRVGAINRFVKYFEDSGEGLAHYWRMLEDYQAAHDVRWGRHYIPHDGDARRMGMQVTTYKKLLEELGARNVEVVPRVQRMDLGIEAMRQILPECEFDAEECADGIKCLDYWSREWDESKGTWSSEVKHDKWSHGADAFRQFAQRFRVVPTERTVVAQPAGVYRNGY